MNLIPRNFLFDDDLEDFFVTKPSKRGEMKCDIYEKDNKYYIELDAPGFDKKDINIEVKYSIKNPQTGDNLNMNILLFIISLFSLNKLKREIKN